MPPEILSKKEKANAFAGDVWACGIILFYMIEGYLPFTGNSSAQIINKIINSPVEFPPES
jgi:serine/threonine protein kinase